MKGSLGGKDIVQLKSNHIPRGLIPLEKFFDKNDVVKDPKVKPAENVVEDKNIGTEENPIIVKLSKKFVTKEKDEYVNLMKNTLMYLHGVTMTSNIMTPPLYNILFQLSLEKNRLGRNSKGLIKFYCL